MTNWSWHIYAWVVSGDLLCCLLKREGNWTTDTFFAFNVYCQVKVKKKYSLKNSNCLEMYLLRLWGAHTTPIYLVSMLMYKWRSLLSNENYFFVGTFLNTRRQKKCSTSGWKNPFLPNKSKHFRFLLFSGEWIDFEREIWTLEKLKKAGSARRRYRRRSIVILEFSFGRKFRKIIQLCQIFYAILFGGIICI